MTRVYVVVEGKSDFDIFKRFFHGKTIVRLMDAGGKYSAVTLAATLIAKKRIPVVLIVDADQTNKKSMEKDKKTIEEIVFRASAGVPFKVVFAVPTVEEEIGSGKTTLFEEIEEFIDKYAMGNGVVRLEKKCKVHSA